MKVSIRLVKSPLIFSIIFPTVFSVGTRGVFAGGPSEGASKDEVIVPIRPVNPSKPSQVVKNCRMVNGYQVCKKSIVVPRCYISTNKLRTLTDREVSKWMINVPVSCAPTVKSGTAPAVLIVRGGDRTSFINKGAISPGMLSINGARQVYKEVPTQRGVNFCVKADNTGRVYIANGFERAGEACDIGQAAITKKGAFVQACVIQKGQALYEFNQCLARSRVTDGCSTIGGGGNGNTFTPPRGNDRHGNNGNGNNGQGNDNGNRGNSGNGDGKSGGRK